MKANKKVIGNLEKCYAMAKLHYNEKEHLLVAAEKVNQCRMYDLDGNFEEVIWEQPGGVMTMVQVPGTNGQFLATHKFYSPNDSKEAKIVIVTPKAKNDWEVRTLVDLPFVHRFDILEKNGRRYLIACALKSGHEFKDDWSMPGKVYGAELPEDLSGFDDEHQLQLTVIKDDMLKNHGYYRFEDENGVSSIVSCDSGVYRFYPPEENGEWKVEQLTDTPASDAVLLDLDEDGEDELFVIAPFHGDTVEIFKKKEDKYQKIYEYPEKLEFLHAIFGGKVDGKTVAIVGHRKGDRQLIAFSVDDKGSFQAEILDRETGAANVLFFKNGDKNVLAATNREIDEIALYELLAK